MFGHNYWLTLVMHWNVFLKILSLKDFLFEISENIKGCFIFSAMMAIFLIKTLYTTLFFEQHNLSQLLLCYLAEQHGFSAKNANISE